MAQAGARKVNWFAIWVTLGVVVALVLVTVLVVSLNNAATPKPLPTEVNTQDRPNAKTIVSASAATTPPTPASGRKPRITPSTTMTVPATR